MPITIAAQTDSGWQYSVAFQVIKDSKNAVLKKLSMPTLEQSPLALCKIGPAFRAVLPSHLSCIMPRSGPMASAFCIIEQLLHHCLKKQ